MPGPSCTENRMMWKITPETSVWPLGSTRPLSLQIRYHVFPARFPAGRRRKRGHVHGVDGHAALQVFDHLLGDADAHDLLRLLRRAADVRRRQHRSEEHTSELQSL